MNYLYHLLPDGRVLDVLLQKLIQTSSSQKLTLGTKLIIYNQLFIQSVQVAEVISIYVLLQAHVAVVLSVQINNCRQRFCDVEQARFFGKR